MSKNKLKLTIHKEVVFNGEIPFPNINSEIYRELYSIETWFRRILYAALIAKYGEGWINELPSLISGELKKRSAGLKGRVHFDCENSRNAIWLTTLDELRQLLIEDKIWPVVRELTGLLREPLAIKLNELREIRNLVGHNRAATKQTMAVFIRTVIDLKDGIDTFKRNIFYDFDAKFRHVIPDDANVVHLIPEYFRTQIKGYSPSDEPWFGESEYFYTIFSMTTQLVDKKVKLSKMLDVYKKHENVILAILINVDENGYTVIWPKRILRDYHTAIIDTFVESEDYVWTDIDYKDQEAKYVCDPKIWFYFKAPEEVFDELARRMENEADDNED